MAALVKISSAFFMICLCIHCLAQQTFPYVSFLGETLANHSYVNLSLVGRSVNDSVQCHTDLGTCCSGAQGARRGDWYFTNDTRLSFNGGGDVFESREAQRVDLRQMAGNNIVPGIYRCDISTEAVHKVSDVNVRDTVYVGLYLDGGEQISCYKMLLRNNNNTRCAAIALRPSTMHPLV